MLLRSFILVSALFLATVWAQEKQCPENECKAPACYCRSSEMPINATGIKTKADIPQFVMLTFDDAVSDSNIEFYRELLTTSRTNPAPTNCPIKATFFVSHEYTNYAYVNELYRKGHEIASHSITHTSMTDEWRTKNESSWKTEMDGLRKIAQRFGLIPQGKILGIRAPFLQTSGNPVFQMLKNNKFLYDSSMPTRKYTHPPMWPYTLDHGFDQDCIITPCPTENFPGVWEVPLVMLWKEREIDGIHEEYPCAMADACIPLPLTANETQEYLYNNFRRHYGSNKAPFPVFLHESWLKDPERKKGYLNFVEDIRKRFLDVYFVTVQEVIAYMKKPIPLKDYKNESCGKNDGGDGCQKRSCNFKIGPQAWETRRMDICTSPCPDGNQYPWIDKLPKE